MIARVFFWSQPFRSHAVPDRLKYAGSPGTGIVFVHGFVCNRGIWNPWLRRLDPLGIVFVAVDLEPVFGGIEGSRVARACRRRLQVKMESAGRPATDAGRQWRGWKRNAGRAAPTGAE